ncbi:SPBP8B7.23, partial [Symbiodinium necroappetens]
ACVLRAQYYGALKHAARKAEASKTRRKVYLMPLGGGVFNNSWELIARSMATAIEMLEDREFESLEIHPLTWSGSAKEKSSLEATFKALLQK